MKRLISANASEILSMNAQELKQSIKASEGRVILSENVAPRKLYWGYHKCRDCQSFWGGYDFVELFRCIKSIHFWLRT